MYFAKSSSTPFYLVFLPLFFISDPHFTQQSQWICQKCKLTPATSPCRVAQECWVTIGTLAWQTACAPWQDSLWETLARSLLPNSFLTCHLASTSFHSSHSNSLILSFPLILPPLEPFVPWARIRISECLIMSNGKNSTMWNSGFKNTGKIKQVPHCVEFP